MKSMQFVLMGVAVLLAISVVPAAGAIITVAGDDDAAMTAAISGTGVGLRLSAAGDSMVSDGHWDLQTGAVGWDDSVHTAMSSPTGGTIDLAWTTPQRLHSLQAYVVAGPASEEGNIDRQCTSVEFFVDQGSGFTSLGIVNTVNTNDVGIFDLTKIDGDWSNVNAARFLFTGVSQGPRVGEVLALGHAVPEPSAIVLCCGALIGLLACAWRKRR